MPERTAVRSVGGHGPLTYDTLEGVGAVLACGDDVVLCHSSRSVLDLLLVGQRYVFRSSLWSAIYNKVAPPTRRISVRGRGGAYYVGEGDEAPLAYFVRPRKRRRLDISGSVRPVKFVKNVPTGAVFPRERTISRKR